MGWVNTRVGLGWDGLGWVGLGLGFSNFAGLGRMLNFKIVAQTLHKFTALHTNIIKYVLFLCPRQL